MVKAYARSAAGMDVELVSEIRSPSTCLVSRQQPLTSKQLTTVENPQVPFWATG